MGAYAIGPGGNERVEARIRALPGHAASLRQLAVAADGTDPWNDEEFTVSAGSLRQALLAGLRRRLRCHGDGAS